MPFRRLLLREPIADTEALQVWMYTQNWDIDGIYAHDAETDQPFEIAWVSPLRDASIHYIDDQEAQVPYFVVVGDEPHEALEMVRNRFDTIPPAEVFDRAYDSETDRASQAMYGGLLATWPEHAKAVAALLERLVGDPSPLVRQTAVGAMGYTQDATWAPRLRDVATHDPDAAVRAAAESVALGLEAL